MKKITLFPLANYLKSEIESLFCCRIIKKAPSIQSTTVTRLNEDDLDRPLQFCEKLLLSCEENPNCMKVRTSASFFFNNKDQQNIWFHLGIEVRRYLNKLFP